MLLNIASSPMALTRLGFRLLLIVCCIIAITSYRIDHRPFEDRHDRAVTEWRFRRNFLFPIPYFLQNSATDDHLANHEATENEDETGSYDKKYIPNSVYDQMNK